MCCKTLAFAFTGQKMIHAFVHSFSQTLTRFFAISNVVNLEQRINGTVNKCIKIFYKMYGTTYTSKVYLPLCMMYRDLLQSKHQKNTKKLKIFVNNPKSNCSPYPSGISVCHILRVHQSHGCLTLQRVLKFYPRSQLNIQNTANIDSYN